MQEKQLDPRNIPEADFPLIVFSDHTSGLVEFAIKWRTKGGYNHTQWANRPGFFASQGNTYSEAPIDRYMKKGNRLKYVEILGLTPVQKKFILASINKKLALPWYKKLYDWIGIAGQAVGIKWINTPGLEYCSEDVPQHLKYMAEKSMPEDSALRKVIMAIPKHASPAEFNEYLKKHPDFFRTYGRWDSDV